MKKMFVNNIFNMSFGKTFFVGKIEGEEEFVGRNKWNLFINDKFIDEIDVEGEQIPLRKTEIVTTNRVLASNKHVDKSSVDLGIDDVMLERV